MSSTVVQAGFFFTQSPHCAYEYPVFSVWVTLTPQLVLPEDLPKLGSSQPSHLTPYNASVIASSESGKG